MKPRVLLAVDFSYQCYRAAASHPTLTRARDDLYTGGLYGFLQSFGKAVRETRATDVLICLDSKPYRRSLTYPDYKQLRKASADDGLLELKQLSGTLILELLALMGVPVWAVPGFESDDLIAATVEVHRSRFVRIYAQSNDSDLYQLLHRPGFAVYRDDINTAVDAQRLSDRTGLTPSEFMLATALMGTHNDIEGIKGVGEKTSAKIVKDPALLRKYRDSHGALIERNLGLIKLPHPEFPRSALIPQRTKTASSRDLYRWLARYDIDCTLQMVNAFEQIRGPDH